jgi:hypothetical protein
MCLTTAARAKAVAGLDEVTRAALEAARAHAVEGNRLTGQRRVAGGAQEVAELEQRLVRLMSQEVPGGIGT